MRAAQPVDQILRVDHAGESGAIRIYPSQLAIARVLHPGSVQALDRMLEHEIAHFKTFDGLLKVRKVRPCPEALAAVESIRRDEKEHEEHAVAHGGNGKGLYRVLRWIVKGATSFAIWLSTKL